MIVKDRAEFFKEAGLRKKKITVPSFRYSRMRRWRSSCLFAFAILISMLSPHLARAAAFTETFDVEPTCGFPTECTMTLGSVSFNLTFTADGEGGFMTHMTSLGDGNSAAMDLQAGMAGGGTERVTITRSDNADFTFTSVYIDNTSSFDPVTVGGYNNNVLVGSAQTVAFGAINTLSFGGITVDEVRITSTDLWIVLDTFVGDSGAAASTVPGAPTIGTATAGDTQASVAFTIPASDGGSAITGYTATSSPGSVTSTGCTASPCTVTGLTNGTPYTFTVTATNAVGTGNASSESNSVTPKASQTITFNNLSAQNFGTNPTLSATASSGLPVILSSSTTGVCTVSGTNLTFISTGTCTIAADQAGDTSYLAATTVSRSFPVNAVLPGAPTIGAAIAGNGEATIAFTIPASDGGSAITGYTATSSPGSVTSTGCTASPCTVTGLTNGTAYTFTVTATNVNGIGSASSESNSVTPKGTQTITFTNPGAKTYGDASMTLNATASSGLPVSFSSVTTSVCTVSGSTLTIITAGTCTINADQAGNSTYNAATQVQQSFTVNKKALTVTADDKTRQYGEANPVFTLSYSGFIYGDNSADLDVIPSISSTATVSSATASYPITPSGGSDNNYDFTLVSGTLTINKAAQTYGDASFTLDAVTTSALPVSFSSVATGVCTVNGSTLTIITAGTCTINADQAGNSNYNAATQVQQSFTGCPRIDLDFLST